MPKRNQGRLELDHRHSPGLPEAFLFRKGIDARQARGLFEAETYTCGHCPKVVMLNPDRVRERTTCRHCDSWICETCSLQFKIDGGECRNLHVFIDRCKEAAARPNGQARLEQLIRSRHA